MVIHKPINCRIFSCQVTSLCLVPLFLDAPFWIDVNSTDTIFCTTVHNHDSITICLNTRYKLKYRAKSHSSGC